MGCTISHSVHGVCSCPCWCCTELEVAWLTMARGTMPARSSCASRISVSTSCVAARLAGYSTCQAIQRLPSGSEKLSIFRSTWSTLWNPVSDLPQDRKQVAWVSKRKCSHVSSFKLSSALMTTNGKGWWARPWQKYLTFYQLRFFKMSIPLCLVNPLLLE